jgi:hypothetical protein
VDQQLRGHIAHRIGSLANTVVLVLNHTDLRTIPIQQHKKKRVVAIYLGPTPSRSPRPPQKRGQVAQGLLINSAIATYLTKPDLRH